MLVGGTSDEPVELGTLGKAEGDLLEQLGVVRAVIVREGDELSAQAAQRGIAGARKAGRRAQRDDLERTGAVEQRRESVVEVLVDEEHAEAPVCLSLEGGEQAFRLGHTADGCHNEVE